MLMRMADCFILGKKGMSLRIKRTIIKNVDARKRIISSMHDQAHLGRDKVLIPNRSLHDNYY